MAPKALPEKPRVRVSYWYEGARLKLELTLMDEHRERVHRETIDCEPTGTLAKMFAAYLAIAANRAIESGHAQPLDALSAETAAPDQPTLWVNSEPDRTSEELAEIRAERAERANAEAPEPEPPTEPEAAPPELEPEQQQLSGDELAAERLRRASQTLVQNTQPPPEEDE